MQFRIIPGYQQTINRLIKSHHNNRVGHALMFLGEEGSANLALATAFAQFINCSDKSEIDSCGVCNSCVKIEKYIHPDVHYYFPTAVTKKVPKKPTSEHYYEEWRNYLKKEHFVRLQDWLEAFDASNKKNLIPTADSAKIIKDLSLKSFESDYRIAIIWLPEKMNAEAANKLLKIIEEPPENVFFFLVTENLDAVISTIRSRTQLIRIGKVSNNAMSTWLKSIKSGLSDDDYTKAVRIGEGNPSMALKSLKTELRDEDLTEYFIQWARICYESRKKMPDIIDWSDNMSRKNKEEQKNFLIYGLDFFRSGLIDMSGAIELNHHSREEKMHVSKFSKLLNPKNSTKIIASFEEANMALERFVNSKILFMNLSVEFGELINPKNVNL